MTEQPVIVQEISWSYLCPWTSILKTLPIAASVTVLAFSLLGVVLTPMGWMLSESLFLNSTTSSITGDELIEAGASEKAEPDGLKTASIKTVRANADLMELVEINRSPYRGVFLATQQHTDSIDFMGLHLSGPRNVFRQLVRPFQYLFDGQFNLRAFFYLLLGCVWSLCVWSFVGLGITRVSLLKLTRNENAGLDDAFEFAIEKWTTAVGAVGIPLLAVAALCLPAGLIGLLMGFDFGVLVAGILWPILLAIASAMGLLLLGLMFGFPLMVSSVGCESQNAFDAMTRAYAYTFQRPVHYLFYCLVAIVFGGLCWMLVAGLTESIVDLSFWSASWGANLTSGDRIDVINGIPLENIEPGSVVKDSSTLTAGRTMIGIWNSLFRTLAAAFIYGLFWCMASAIYLLLRKDADETEMDEIYIVDEKRTYELPPLQSDENGIPQVQEPRPVAEETSDQTDDGESSDSATT